MRNYYLKLKHVVAPLLGAMFIFAGLCGSPVTASARDAFIPGSGGSVQVGEQTAFPFTPGSTGFWRFETSNNIGCDPFLRLDDDSGNTIAEDDDGGGGLNALIVAYLVEGKRYTIHAEFVDVEGGGYTLQVTKMGIPDAISAGDTAVSGHTMFTFTPESSGEWTIRTLDNVDCDPMLWLYDESGNLIAMDDDSGGDLNALITAHLEQGEQYIIRAGFFGPQGTYTLRVEK